MTRKTQFKNNTKIDSTLFDRIFQIFCSLKLAVLVILSLAIALATATIIESVYDTPTAQYWVYRSFGFHGILFLLGLNIFCVALSRLPWKKKHIPFLLAHAGILILLVGSWITEQFGIDGSLRVSEGETASLLELDQSYFWIWDKKKTYSVPIQWLPPTVSFKPISLKKFGIPYDIELTQWITHAEPQVSYIAHPNLSLEDSFKSSDHLNQASRQVPAVRFKLTGGPMAISQEFWLWDGAPESRMIQAGPAQFSIHQALPSVQSPKLSTISVNQTQWSGPQFNFQGENDGGLSYNSRSSEGKIIQGRFKKDQVIHQVIHTGWKGNLDITILDWIPDATILTQYKPARIQYGNLAPSSAVHVVTPGKQDIWLGLGDRAVLHLEDQEIEMAYFPKRIVLPFTVKLDKFSIEHDQGTLNPASYSSHVIANSAQGTKDAVISMNEPLSLGSYTVYQASYEDAEPRPTTSIFSVNRDPGRPWKYLGSFLIVFGSILLFAMKYKTKQGPVKVY